ncbi:MAG: hypothetical protein ACI9XU_001306, partial [Arenicella sp.]
WAKKIMPSLFDDLVQEYIVAPKIALTNVTDEQLY